MPSDLVPIRYRSPGSLGLVTDEEGSAIDPAWAVVLTNAVISKANRVTARDGWNMLTSSPHSDDTEALYEFVEDSSNTFIISAAGLKLYSGTATLTDRTGAAPATQTAPTANDWQFVTLADCCIGFQESHEPILFEPDSAAGTPSIATQAADFEDISNTTGYAGSAPQGDAAIATHGRIFAFDSTKRTIQWCALLQPQVWTGAGTGSIGLDNIWPIGTDIGVALVEWNDFLVVFGERSVLLFTGLNDPATNLTIAATTTASGQADAIASDGLVARDAVVSVGTDLVFMSRSGLRSLSRALVGDNLPFSSLAPHIQLQLTEEIDTAIGNGDPIRIEYHRPLSAIVARIGDNYWYFDVRTLGQIRASKWEGIDWKSAKSIQGVLYLGQNGGVADYSTNQDDTASYTFKYQSPWIPITGQANRTLIGKEAHIYYESDVDRVINLDWSWDYTGQSFNDSQVLDTTDAAEWGTGEWGEDEWGTNPTLSVLTHDLAGEGSLLQFCSSTIIDGGTFGIQQIEIFGKLGKLG